MNMKDLKIIVNGPVLVDAECFHCKGTTWLSNAEDSSWKKCFYCAATGILTNCPFCMYEGCSLGIVGEENGIPKECPHCEASGVLTGKYAHSNIK